MSESVIGVQMGSELKSLAEKLAKQERQSLSEFIQAILIEKVEQAYPEAYNKLANKETQPVPACYGESIKDKMIYSEILVNQASALNADW